MLRISQLKIKADHTQEELISKVRSILHVAASDIKKIEIKKQSLDARKKPNLFYVYTVDVKVADEASVLRYLKKRKLSEDVKKCEEEAYVFPNEGEAELKYAPVIVGCGPAGLFCAYFLAKYGYQPILIERGAPVEERQADVEAFWETGILKPNSNVQFGEGGAGTFSDGKLNTLVKDPGGRIRRVLEIFVKHGAPEDILYVNKPHIGTDILIDVIRNMRNYIIEKGGKIHFHTTMTRLIVEKQSIVGVEVENDSHKSIIHTNHVILAPGHSARDTFKMLHEMQIPMEAKSFAVGVRMEHPQEMINQSQYGKGYSSKLPTAAYKITAKLSDGRGAYSFCMCPGGYVVNASSEEGRLAVNGMSYHARDSRNANSAIIVTITPEDYGNGEPLSGVAFQRKLEEAAYNAGEGKIPMQRLGDYAKAVQGHWEGTNFDVDEELFENHEPCMKGEYKEADLKNIFPDFLNRALLEGIAGFDRKIHGFAHENSILSAVESRTSSPVRIVRNEQMESTITGLYPCGEGAGYAGGITSAAVDGLKIAEVIRKTYKHIVK